MNKINTYRVVEKDTDHLPLYINFKCFVLMAARITQEYLFDDRSDFLVFKYIRLNVDEVCLINRQEDNEVSLHPEAASNVFRRSCRSIHQSSPIILLTPSFFLIWHRDSLFGDCVRQACPTPSWLLLHRNFLRLLPTSVTVFFCRKRFPLLLHLL